MRLRLLIVATVKSNLRSLLYNGGKKYQRGSNELATTVSIVVLIKRTRRPS